MKDGEIVETVPNKALSQKIFWLAGWWGANYR